MVNVSQVFSQTLDSNKDVLVDWLTPVDKKLSNISEMHLKIGEKEEYTIFMLIFVVKCMFGGHRAPLLPPGAPGNCLVCLMAGPPLLLVLTRKVVVYISGS